MINFCYYGQSLHFLPGSIRLAVGVFMGILHPCLSVHKRLQSPQMSKESVGLSTTICVGIKAGSSGRALDALNHRCSPSCGFL